jgi:hypothetical protein
MSAADCLRGFDNEILPMHLRKRLVFGVTFGLILAIATLAGIELLASFYTPPWPARALVSLEPVTSAHDLMPPFNRQPWLGNADNSWGMRDTERTIDKPAGAFRAVFVGDSFVESRFTPLSLAAAVKQHLPATDSRVEAIGLGVPGTDPRSYYYRIRDVALKISPDAILLFFYAGNDFMPSDQGYSIWPRLVDESAGGSLVGWLMPRTNWLLVNRLNLSNFFQARAPAPPNEEMMLDAALKAPPDERLGRIVAHIKKYNYPQLPEAQITEILSRGDNRFWQAATSKEGEQEFLLGWALDTVINWESRDFDVAKDRQDAARLAGYGEVQASLSWLEAADRVARAKGVPLLVFLAPVGFVDPDYAEFWKPWPRAYSWNYLCDERQSRLAAALAKTKIHFFDLRDDLNGIPGTYRKLDGHWSQKGEAIVAGRVQRELRSLVAHVESRKSDF